MADRPRGGRGGGGHRGGDRGNYRGRGGGGHHRGGGHQDNKQAGGAEGTTERPRKENILDLSKYMDKKVNVKFNGGREVSGTLKGYDALMNLVLDDVEEVMRGLCPSSPAVDFGILSWTRILTCGLLTDDEGNETTRSLGLVVVRGTLLVVISPVDGSEVIANPFAQAEEE
jgi:U6 snRNA-associated Sm-like protein LSm7